VRPARETWINPAASLVLCAGAGAAFAWARIPLPWMTGPLVAMAVLNFAGAGMRAAPAGRALGQILIGSALGLYFTPPVAREVLSYWPLLAAAALIAIGLGALCGWVLGRTTGTDATSAFFASVPGGAAEMTLLGERYGAKVERIALAQSLRIVVVVIAVPFALTYSGAHGSDAYQPAAVALHWPRLAGLLALAGAAGGLIALAGLPNAFMFGPLAVAIALTASGIELSSMPAPLTNAAQLLIGCALGSRFEPHSLRTMPRYVAGVLLSVALAIGAAATLAFALAWWSGVPAPSLVLAVAPGGIAEMCITAKVLQLGVPLVTAAHVTRVLVLITATGPVYRAASAIHARFARR
jgi:membrane AbrB-like protein